jgi:hypothetical protein
LGDHEAASNKVSEFTHNKSHDTDPNQRSSESSPSVAVLGRRDGSEKEFPTHSPEVEKGFFSVDFVNISFF